jgi:hypothetical protein
MKDLFRRNPSSPAGMSNDGILVLAFLLISAIFFIAFVLRFILSGGWNPDRSFDAPASLSFTRTVAPRFTPTPKSTNELSSTQSVTVTLDSSLTQNITPSRTSIPKTKTPVQFGTETPGGAKTQTPTITNTPACATSVPSGGLTPIADTWIDAASVDANHGADAVLFTQISIGAERRALLKFNPTGSVSVATLYLHVQLTSPGMTISLYRVTSAWNESTTWNNTLNAPWNKSGGDYNSAPIISFQPVDNCVVPLVVPITVTSLVQGWVAAPTSNFGIILIASGSDGSQTKLASREDVANAPSLVITP